MARQMLRPVAAMMAVLFLYWMFFSNPTGTCTQYKYAIMIDAGSTGSRVHVYKFSTCGPVPQLINEEFKMTEKREGGSGLSSYKTDAEGAAKSLDPLLQVAMDTIPDEYKSCSPVAVKATAGLRLLGEKMSADILDAVRYRLETVYPFPVVSKEQGGVEIMPGEMEGVYAWITTNYLLGKIGGPEKSPTAAIFDLGGGSTQIVFEPTFPLSPSGGMPTHMEEGDHKYRLEFGGRTFELYQHSHLGYGLMSARKALHAVVLEDQLIKNPDSLAWLDEPISNACIAPGATRKVTVTFPTGHRLAGDQTVTMQGPTQASPSKCRSLAARVLHKDEACNLAPCSFNGIHQPSLQSTFAREDLYIFSYFYDRTKDLGMPDNFTIRELHELTQKVCSGSWQTNFGGMKTSDGADVIAELNDRPEWCLDLNFILALLNNGYELTYEREVKIAKKIAGNELGWCLGASLPLLDFRCEAKKIS